MIKKEEPRYPLRGIDLYAFQDEASFLDFLLPDEKPRSGTLVAINAEKMLTLESDAQVRALIEQAEFKSVRFPQIKTELPGPICGRR